SDLVAELFDKPHIAVRPCRDTEEGAGWRGNRSLPDRARGRDAPDSVGPLFGEPQVAVRPSRDHSGRSVERGQRECVEENDRLWRQTATAYVLSCGRVSQWRERR